MIDFSIIVTIKNRKEHFLKTFSSLLTQQQPQNYEIIFVDYSSQDGFEHALKEQIQNYLPLVSDSLCLVKRIYLQKDFDFNSGRAKNIGAKFSSSSLLSFTDADVFLGMNYHNHWLHILSYTSNSFFVSRVQETTECNAHRISPKTNYGNMIISKNKFIEIGGYNENNTSWGGDDDDIIHRLKLKNLREINPHSVYDSLQTSILHDDELRTKFLENNEKSIELSKLKFEEIYKNSCPINSNFLSFYNENKSLIQVEKIYEKS